MITKPYSQTTLISVEDALATILDTVHLMPVETAGLINCHGRVLANDVICDTDIAAFANSSMDGFAICCDDLAAATPDNPVVLDVVGVIGAGSVYPETLQSGQALRIMTGAPVPDGANCVVKIEDSEVLGQSPDCPQGLQVSFTQPQQPKANIRAAGEEARAGDILLHNGEIINAAGVGLLATLGVTEVGVYGRPHLAIISSGSELVEVHEKPGPGQIRNSNTFALAAQAEAAGARVSICPKIDDTPQAFLEAFRAAAAGHDMVIISGGAAEGDFDYTTKTIRELGEVFFNKVSMKPGKAQTFGIINGVPIFGLPGNPAAAAVGFEILVRPALRKMQGFSAIYRPTSQASISLSLEKTEVRREYLRASLRANANGNLEVTPFRNQSSAVLRTLYEGNCLLVLPEQRQSIAQGDLVACYRLDLPEGALL